MMQKARPSFKEKDKMLLSWLFFSAALGEQSVEELLGGCLAVSFLLWVVIFFYFFSLRGVKVRHPVNALATPKSFPIKKMIEIKIWARM
jgi:hypothetical protein